MATTRSTPPFAFGGPPLLIRTVNHLTGLKVNHMVLVDFTGFKDLIDSLGGVTIYNPSKVVSSQPFDGLIWHFAKGTIHARRPPRAGLRPHPPHHQPARHRHHPHRAPAAGDARR